jgi:tellurite resistance protein TehA-like permease
MYVHQTALSTMTAAWLLPIVATIVAAASGGVVAEVLPNPQHALWTLIISYILWGTGVPLAMAVLVIYFQRLTIHKLPPREVIVSVFLPLGPLGQGGFAIMQLGKVAMEIFPKTGTLPTAGMMNAGDMLYVIGWLTATVMWGFGLVWLFFAAASISRSKFPFNMGWWGFTFPLGVFTTSTTQMAKELPSAFFKVLGTVSSPHLKVVRIHTNDDADLLRSGHFTLDLGYDQNSDESCYWRYVLRTLFERSRRQEGRG